MSSLCAAFHSSECITFPIWALLSFSLCSSLNGGLFFPSPPILIFALCSRVCLMPLIFDATFSIDSALLFIPRELPATCDILYSGRNLSIHFCSKNKQLISAQTSIILNTKAVALYLFHAFCKWELE